jgi:hypothetical protein
MVETVEFIGEPIVREVLLSVSHNSANLSFFNLFLVPSPMEFFCCRKMHFQHKKYV